MTKLTIDRDLRSRLGDLKQPLELCDEDGRVLAHLQPIADDKSPEVGSYSDEELIAISRRTSGRSLSEFWRDLKARV